MQSIDAEAIGLAAISLGAGRVRKEDDIDHGTWIWVKKKVGERVERGDDLAWFSAPRRVAHNVSREAVVAHVQSAIQKAYVLGPEPPPARPLIFEVIR